MDDKEDRSTADEIYAREREEEERLDCEKIDGGADSGEAYSQYVAKNLIRARGVMTGRQKAELAVLLIGCLGCFAALCFFIVKENVTGIIISVAVLFALVLGFLAMVSIRQRILIKKKIDPDVYEKKTGRVLGCAASVIAITGSSDGVDERVRMARITYQLKIEVDGKSYEAYAQNFIGTGTRLTVFVRKDKKGAAILPDELKND